MRRTYTVDVKKRPLGRAATEIASLLMGKNDENYSPHEDKGAFVVVKNIEEIALTGKKKENKKYYYHSGYLGGLKEVSYEKLLQKSRSAALKKAVYGMLPKNKLRKEMIKRIKID